MVAFPRLRDKLQDMKIKSPSYRRKNLLSRDEARAILEPHIQPLIQNLEDAWGWVQDIMDEDDERRVVLDASLEAAMVSQRFIFQTRHQLEGTDRVKIKMHGRHMSVVFNEGLKLRFKKLDQKLRSGNVRTNRQRAIYHQYTLHGVNDPTDVTFGYVLTPAGDQIHGVYVTCPIGWSKNAWMIVVRDPGMGALPLFTGDDAPDAPEFIVRPKAARKESGGSSA
jgi:hypothetical protein